MAKKKATKVPEGITSRMTATGINVTISENGRKIATLRGYNNNQNVQKGLHALRNALNKSLGLSQSIPSPVGKFAVTDLTPKKRKKGVQFIRMRPAETLNITFPKKRKKK